jgi:Domain of unknown function (DUF5925)
MENNDPLPFVVNVDDADEPGDVLDSLALGPFIAGRHPIARTRQLSRVRPDATFIPAGSSSYRVADGHWRTVVLSEGPGWTLKAVRFRDNTASLSVTATDAPLAEAILAEVSAGAIAPPPPVGLSIPVGFWHIGARGPQRSTRPIEVTPWASIRRNYTGTVATALDELMSLAPAKLTGRISDPAGPPRSLIAAHGRICDMTSPAELLLDTATAQLANQEASLSALRNRSATVLASAGVVAGFFAATTGHPNLLLAAAALFGVGAVLSVVILIPIYTWHFAADIRGQLEWAKTATPQQGDELALNFAGGLENQRELNKSQLANLTWVFAAQCAFLGAQVTVEAVARGLSF